MKVMTGLNITPLEEKILKRLRNGKKAIAEPADDQEKCKNARTSTSKSKANQKIDPALIDIVKPARHKKTIQDIPTEEELFYDLERYCRELLWIRDKRGRIIPFYFNEVQRRLHQKVERLSREGRRHRLILKYRRPGITTYFQARNFHVTANDTNKSAVTLAHDHQSTSKIFAISLLFYDKLPSWAKPSRSTESKKELNFDKLRSEFYIGTAGGRSFGRGQTLHAVHCSEAAFYPKSVDIANLMAGLMEAASHGEINVETTANGHGNWFHKTWVGAKNNENIWVPIFLSWKDDPELTIPTDLDYEGLKLSTEEEELVKAYHLKPGQIVWRRVKQRELYDPDRGDAIFKQEYPINDVEAFISTGVCFFDASLITHLANLCDHPIRTGDGGRLKIWQEPLPYHSYIVAADTGEGVPGGSRTVITVLDVSTCIQVATWVGITSPEDCAEKMAELGSIYNKALLAPEANNYGHSTISTLLNSINYPYIYKHTDYQAIRVDTGETVLPKFGWQTNNKTRPIMITEFRYALQNGLLKINDAELFQEALSFVNNGHGRYEAAPDAYDDRIMANAIAWQARKKAVDLSGISLYAIDTGYRTISTQWEEI